ncbi:hypothetical protein ScalyP_jg9845 [Parmales sp. scaly parma]|nr:hypothetical protein ScalyP_jg9845 [Parmales sp. scaly parma]
MTTVLERHSNLVRSITELKSSNAATQNQISDLSEQLSSILASIASLKSQTDSESTRASTHDMSIIILNEREAEVSKARSLKLNYRDDCLLRLNAVSASLLALDVMFVKENDTCYEKLTVDLVAREQLSALNSQYRSQLSRTELSTSQLSSLTSQLSKINGEKKDKVQRLSQLQVQLNRLRAGSAGDEKSGRELSRSKGLLEVAVEVAQKELVGSREAREKSTASNFPTAPTTTTQIEDDDDDDEEFDEMLIAGPMFGSDNYH